MTPAIFFKASLIWLAIACLAVLNGILRQQLVAPMLGSGLALPISGITLSLMVFLVTYIFIGFFRTTEPADYFLIGAQWVVMTLAFEFLFGHFVVGKSWGQLLQTFNIAQGDLFLVVLVVSLLSPYAAARIKGILR